MNASRPIFFLNGRKTNWTIGKKKKMWGLPLFGKKWSDAQARLQEIGFYAGAEILAVSGPFAHFRAVIGSHRGVYYDSGDAPWGLGPRNDVYPVRFELTNIQDINRDWFDGLRGNYWQGPLQDVYFSMKSLYVLSSKNIHAAHVNEEAVFGTNQPGKDSHDLPSAPDSFEDATAEKFSQLGYRIERLGHRRAFDRVPDGIGTLQKSVVMYAKSLNTNPYFVLWDCKFNCGPNGLKAEDERAIKEYIETYASARKADAAAGEFWFFIVAPNKAVADRIHSGVCHWTWPSGCRQIGLRGLRVLSFSSLESLAKLAIEHRLSGRDPDSFLLSQLPFEFEKPYLG